MRNIHRNGENAERWRRRRACSRCRWSSSSFGRHKYSNTYSGECRRRSAESDQGRSGNCIDSETDDEDRFASDSAIDINKQRGDAGRELVPLLLLPPPPPPLPRLPLRRLRIRWRRRHHTLECRPTPLRFSYSSGGMEASAGTALYPLHRCKTIYLVRHAQGIHNVEGEKDQTSFMSPALLDAHLTSFGWSQVDCLREHVTKCGLAKKIELVITSPLLRTMQTAVGVFGGGNCTDGVNASPLLMVEGAGHSGRQAISSLNCPPFLAVEACREHVGVNPCDKRSSITKYRTLFPAIDFSLIENDEDVLWEADVRESDESVAARGMKFFDWLWTREEKEIAIVSHWGFLYQTLNMYGKECHPTIDEELGKEFANCELRSMVLVDRSMLGSDAPTCNFPGKIPAGLDLPSEVAEQKQ